METDALIDRLAADRRPAPRPALGVGLALTAAGLACMVAFTMLFAAPLAWLEPGKAAALALKLGFGLAFTVAAAAGALATGRPGQALSRRIAALAAPLALIAFAAVLELGSGATMDTVRGETGLRCVLAIAGGGLATLPAMLFALRTLAPLNPAKTGLFAGLAAAGGAASAYALFCPETTAAFLVAHYLPAILAVGLAGAALGARVLRW